MVMHIVPLLCTKCMPLTPGLINFISTFASSYTGIFTQIVGRKKGYDVLVTLINNNINPMYSLVHRWEKKQE